MVRIRFIDKHGKPHDVDAAPGKTLMEVAVENMIAGVLADCGGACACATCHCHIERSWWDRIGQPGEDEAAMVGGAFGYEPQSSRLTCQIKVTEAMEGVEVRAADNG